MDQRQWPKKKNLKLKEKEKNRCWSWFLTPALKKHWTPEKRGYLIWCRWHWNAQLKSQLKPRPHVFCFTCKYFTLFTYQALSNAMIPFTIRLPGSYKAIWWTKHCVTLAWLEQGFTNITNLPRYFKGEKFMAISQIWTWVDS